MGSKYRLVSHLSEVFAGLGGISALGASSGSGAVAYPLNTPGYQVTARDFLSFPAVIARATVSRDDSACRTRLAPGSLTVMDRAPSDLVIPPGAHAEIAVTARGFDPAGSALAAAVREIKEEAFRRAPRGPRR
ncbi:MAG TPA: hypothetical protein VKV38_17400 [Trebonia sp.]|jgi:hypothetical protein|nr:hypothetical protein [Trebonia sp.]